MPNHKSIYLEFFFSWKEKNLGIRAISLWMRQNEREFIKEKRRKGELKVGIMWMT